MELECDEEPELVLTVGPGPESTSVLEPVNAAEPALVLKLALEQEVAGELALEHRRRDSDTAEEQGLEETRLEGELGTRQEPRQKPTGPASAASWLGGDSGGHSSSVH